MATLPLPTFLSCLELGLQVNHHDLIPCFSCELAEMSHVSLPKKGEPGAITRLNMFWTIWLSPGASGTRGTTNASDYLHVLVLRSRNAKELIEQWTSSDCLSSCPMCFHSPLTTLVSGQKLFPLFLLQRCLVNNISTWLWSLVAGTELTVSWDPEISSLFLCFYPFSPTRFIKQSPYKI